MNWYEGWKLESASKPNADECERCITKKLQVIAWGIIEEFKKACYETNIKCAKLTNIQIKNEGLLCSLYDAFRYNIYGHFPEIEVAIQNSEIYLILKKVEELAEELRQDTSEIAKCARAH